MLSLFFVRRSGDEQFLSSNLRSGWAENGRFVASSNSEAHFLFGRVLPYSSAGQFGIHSGFISAVLVGFELKPYAEDTWLLKPKFYSMTIGFLSSEATLAYLTTAVLGLVFFALKLPRSFKGAVCPR